MISVEKEDELLVSQIFDSPVGEKILPLLDGNIDGYRSQELAESALCGTLAGFTNDPEQIDRIFRRSNLMSPAWEERSETVIAKALRTGAAGAPSMADLREYIDFQIDNGVRFTADEVCRALAASKRGHRVAVYNYLLRLVREKVIKKDPYRHGGYKKIGAISSYDMGGAIAQDRAFRVKMPLDLDRLLKTQPNQLISLAGESDAGKSSFEYQVMKSNYQKWPVIHFSSPEWDLDAIKQRMDDVGIERPHPNITCYPMEPGYEDLIPPGPCIVLVDYLRTNENFNEIDRQYHAILENLKGGIAFTAIQKHIGQDKPTSGQFAVHAPHHILLLSPWKDVFVCKILKTKNERPLKGYYRIYKFENYLLKPVSKEWKQGEILWNRKPQFKDNSDNKDNR